MSRFFFARLAADTMKKNRGLYVPYILTCIATTAMYYIVRSLALSEDLFKMHGAAIIAYTMDTGSYVIALFALIFLFYTNSFLMKRRKKELGLFRILGMEKRHLSFVTAWETLYTAVISLAGGIPLGLMLYKAIYLIVLKVIGIGVTLGFYVSWQAILETACLFAGIFALIFLHSLRQLCTVSPMELLLGSHTGEREPKAKWLLALTGAVCLGSGYYLAVAVENPVAAITVFFIAVILVIIGTYLLFTAGSIVFLKLLRKNKRYYYQTAHFTSISGLLYRMKQNAVGLANICILSAMTLFLVSSTSSMMVGIEEAIAVRYPYDLMFYTDEDSEEKNSRCVELARDTVEESGCTVTQELFYHYLAIPMLREGARFEWKTGGSDVNLNHICNLYLIPLEDYNAAVGENNVLNDGEVLIYAHRTPYKEESLWLDGREYTVSGHLSCFPGNGQAGANIAESYFVVVPDREMLETLFERAREYYGERTSAIRQYYCLDIEGSDEEKIAVFEKIRTAFLEIGYQGSMEQRATARSGFLALYGGLFFLGIFLGLLFMMAMILIVYYKQISEGYDDRERFQILKKVGMSDEEVRRTIHSQILTVFFLPIVTAGIHMLFACPLIEKVLRMLNLLNDTVFRLCLVVSFGTFAFLYAVIYGMTARTYYRIVSR